MGITIGGGSSIPPDGAISTEKIADEAVTEGKLDPAVVSQLGVRPVQYAVTSSVQTKGAVNTVVFQIPAFTTQEGSGITRTNDANSGGYISVAENGLYEVSLQIYQTTGTNHQVYARVDSAITNTPDNTYARQFLLKYFTTFVGVESCVFYITTADKLFFQSYFTPNTSIPELNRLVIARVG